MLQDLGNGIGYIIYNIDNLPVTIYKTSGSQFIYHYDVNGQRVLSTGSNKYFINDFSGRQEALVNRSDNSKIEYNIYGNDLIGQVNRVGTTLNRYYYLKDHLGSIRVRVNSLGAIDGYDSYYPYGMQMNGLCSTSGLDVRYKFTGKERDTETNYDYFGARYYDARIARWLQVDPLASKYPHWSPYNYALNNPIRLIDTDGRVVGDPVTLGVSTATAVGIGVGVTITAGIIVTSKYLKDPSSNPAPSNLTIAVKAGELVVDFYNKVSSWFNDDGRANSEIKTNTEDSDTDATTNNPTVKNIEKKGRKLEEMELNQR